MGEGDVELREGRRRGASRTLDDNTARMKPTQTLLKRVKLRLTTKGANKGFYKGTGSGAMGEHTKYGGYKLDWEKIRTYVVPEGLKDTKVRTEAKLTVSEKRRQELLLITCIAHAVRDAADDAYQREFQGHASD